MQRTTTAVLLVGVVLVAALGTAGVAMALTDGPSAQQNLQTDTTENDRSITVSAQGQAETQPDKAVVRIAVESVSPDATTARTQAAENVSAVKTALTELGIAEEDIRTADYRIYSDRDRRPPGEEPAEPQFHARHTLVIDVTDVEAAGEVIDAAVDAGATDVQDVQFTLAEETRLTLRNEALTAAMDNARTQADTLATSAELEITGVHDVTTQDYRGPVVRYETAYAGDAAGGTDISSGPVSVTAQVTVTYNASG